MDTSSRKAKASRMNGKKGGRPVASKTLITQKIRERIVEKLYERIDPLIDAQLNSAIGVILKKTDNKGLHHYLEEAPSTSAARFLVEQVLGRPKESIEHSGGAKGLIALVTSLQESDPKDE